MGSNLGAWDLTKPDGASQQVSVLDDYVKETRVDLIGWSAIEHDDEGRHKFPIGVTSARPSGSGSNPAVAGSIYINTQTGYLEYTPDGTNWYRLGSIADDINYVWNGDMELWGAGGSAAPSGWTLSGAGASCSRETSNIKEGLASVTITRAGANASLVQDVSLAFHGATFWRGKRVVLGAWVRDPGSAEGKIAIADGIGTTTSSAQTGGSTFEWMQIQRDIDASATKVEVQLLAQTGNGNIQFDGVRLSIGNAIGNFIPGLWHKKDSMIPFGDAVASIAAGTTTYLGISSNTTEFGIPMGFSGIIKGLFVRSSTVPGSGKNYTYTVRVNGSDTSMAAAISGAASQSGSDETVTSQKKFVKNDYVSIKLVTDVASNAGAHQAVLLVERMPTGL